MGERERERSRCHSASNGDDIEGLPFVSKEFELPCAGVPGKLAGLRCLLFDEL